MKNVLSERRDNELAKRLNDERIIKGDKRFVQPPTMSFSNLAFSGPTVIPWGEWGRFQLNGTGNPTGRVVQLQDEWAIFIDTLDDNGLYPTGSNWDNVLGMIINISCFFTAINNDADSTLYVIIQNFDDVDHTFWFAGRIRDYELTQN